MIELELERLLLHELSSTYTHLNQLYFRGVLRCPQLALSEASSFLGRWLRETRVIELSKPLLLQQPWGSVVEVLKHEMAHQYVHEVLREAESAHGPAFRAVCERLGIDARASGVPNPKGEVPQTPSALRLLARVEKLLALAQSDNQHEAEAAAAAAQKLILRHNLTLPAAADGPTGYGFRHLGRVTARVSEWERRLGNLLSTHFCVEVIWVPAYRPLEGKRGSVMEAIGSPENLELSAYVYDFLSRTAERLWLEHKRALGLTQNRERMTFLAGVMSGFAHKLDEQARAHRAEGLVWVPHAALHAYTKKRHPHVRTVAHQGHRRGDAFSHGQKAGRELVLHRGLTHRGSGETRLLRS